MEIVRAHMGLGVNEDVRRRAAGGQALQDEAVPGVLGAGVQLPVGEGPGPAFAKLDVGLRVQSPGGPEALHVRLAGLHGPAPLQVYLFYKSKELLLFEVIQEQQKNINLELYQAFSDIVDMELSAEKLTDMIFEFYKKTEKMLVLKLSDAGEIELLKRKLPQEIVDEHLQDDTDMIKKMIALFHVKKEVDINVISAAFHAIYYATLHKADIGEEQYDNALQVLIYGIVTQII